AAIADQQHAEAALEIALHAIVPIAQCASIAVDVDDGALAWLGGRIPCRQRQSVGGPDRLLAHVRSNRGIDEVERSDAGAEHKAALGRPQIAKSRQIDRSDSDENIQHKAHDAFPLHDRPAISVAIPPALPAGEAAFMLCQKMPKPPSVTCIWRAF